MSAVLPLNPDAGLYISISLVMLIIIYVESKNANEKLKNITTLQLFIVAFSATVYYVGFIHPSEFFSNINRYYYVDLVVTIPITIYILSYTATEKITDNARKSIILTVITIGLWSQTIGSSDPTGLFIIGLLTFILSVYFLITDDKIRNLSILTGLTVLCWSIYPIVWFETSGDLVVMRELLVLVPLVGNHLFIYLTIQRLK